MIPLIDCSLIAEGAFEDVHEDNLQKFAQKFGVAMTERGMCNLINHGIDKEKIANVLKLSRTFFELPTETKSKYGKGDVRKSLHGYIGPGGEHFHKVNLKQKNSTELRETWDTWGANGHDDKYYPMDEVPDFKSVIDEVRRELENLAKKILRCIEIYLHLDNGALLSAHKNLNDYSIETQTTIRSLYYYPLDSKQIENAPSDAIRCGEHSDFGTITLLMQDMVGGLEVKTTDGNWLDATPIENAVLLNSGQLLEHWTGGRFHAALPTETKTKYKKVDVRKSFHGYIGPGEELANEKQKNSTELRESWDSWGLDGHDDKHYPMDEVPEFKSVIDEVRRELENLAKKILRCIEIYLHLDNGALLSAHKNLDDYSIETQTLFRTLHYYHLDREQIENAPSDAVRLGEHSDYGTITLLMQDMVGGLEVKTLEGNWLDATPVENAILLNSGQLLEYWTGGRFHAALHRVKIKLNQGMAASRQSFIYFVNPDRGTNVFPLMPVLIDKVAQFEKFNNQSVNAYDYFQKIIELTFGVY